jgi:hypothetical protein
MSSNDNSATESDAQTTESETAESSTTVAGAESVPATATKRKTTDSTDSTGSTVAPDTRVPPGESPHECRFCGRPFRHETQLVLHRGLDHGDDLTDEEVETFQDAYRDENEEIRLFRLKALALLVLLYFGFLYTYSIV